MRLYGLFLALGIRLPPAWSFSPGPIFLYLGPETIMPLASILAAVVGVLLIAWRQVLGFLRRITGRSSGKPPEEPGIEGTTDDENGQQVQ